MLIIEVQKEEDIIVREPEDVQQEQTKIVSEHNLTQEVIYDNASLTDNQIVDRSADKPFINKSNELKRFTDENDKYWAYYDIRIATNSYAYQVKNKTEKWVRIVHDMKQKVDDNNL